MRSAELPALRAGRTPEPPYYAVIFTSKRTAGDNGYGAMSDRMVALAQQQPGFLGVDSARSDDGIGITVAYWKDEASIKAWKQNLEHLEAQDQGRKKWYECYQLRIAKVERAYGYEAPKTKA